MAEVALSLSGGGFRAAMFHLGTLHYLHNLRYEDGHSFLEDIHTFSTISGGTLTGLWYMMNYCEGRDMNEAIEELYQKMIDSSLPDIVIPSLLEEPKSKTSLICEMAMAYDKVFFDNKQFSIVWDKIDHGPIHHFCAGGTDFGNGLPFRFQATREIKNAEKKEFSRGFVGNLSHRVPESIAQQIKLSEVMAVSSCFPGAFEPMRFPVDFQFSTKAENSDYVNSCKKFGVMDGGIVDNQGVEALILANTHLTYDEPKANKEGKTDTEYPCLDLLIISDVANPHVPQEKTKLMKKFKTWNLIGVNAALLFTLLLGVASIIEGVSFSIPIFTIMGIILTALAEPLFFLLVIVDILLLVGIKQAPFDISGTNILKIRFSKFWVLLTSRFNSLKSLITNVFMKHIRKMQYNTLYRDKKWQSRLISNNLSELSTKGSWQWKKDFPKYLIPSERMKANTDIVANMSSTLWFTSAHIKDGYPQSLFSSGQYTICMNLLEYIAKVKKMDVKDRTTFQTNMLSLEPALMKDWEAFLADPQCMLLPL